MNQQTDYPKIGIRPIIDGRLGGVRESLEETTMKMAQNVAALYEKELRYPDGTPVRCVIADQSIGGVHEANMCAKKFEANNVGVSLSVTPCWAYGSETMDMHPTIPKAIWGFNGTQRPWSSISGCYFSRPQPVWFAGFWYLRQRRSGFGR
jgi:L-fucose isomerase